MKINNKKGFTLIELMVVIAIIAILATAGVSMYGTYQAKARDTKRITNLNNLTIGLQGYYTDKTEYPEPHSANCLTNETGMVHASLGSYYDNKAVPLDPQKSRVVGNCTVKGSPLYKQLTKDGTAKTAYLIASNLEVKDKANLKYKDSLTTYESIAGVGTTTGSPASTAADHIGKLEDTDRNTTNVDAKKNIVYAILGN